MKAIFGLGNPGPEYAKTRHNAGFGAVLRLLGKNPGSWSEPRAKKFGPIWSRQPAVAAEAKDGKALVVLPQTFMNNSGPCVKAAVRDHGLKPSDVLVVCDEAQLPLGQMRFGASGSSGGHNGLESVIRAMGTEDVPRLRIGVGPRPASEKLKDFVLGEFKPVEKPVVEDTIRRAAEAAEFWLENGTEAAMNRYNTKAT